MMKPTRLLLLSLPLAGMLLAGTHPIVRAIEEVGSPAAAIRSEREQMLRNRSQTRAGSSREVMQPADPVPDLPPTAADAAAAKRQFIGRRQQRLKDLADQGALSDAKRSCVLMTDTTAKASCFRDVHKAALTKRQRQLRQAQLACLQQNQKEMAALVACTVEALQVSGQ